MLPEIAKTMGSTLSQLLVITPTLGCSVYLDRAVASITRFADGARHVIVAPEAAVEGLGNRFPDSIVMAEMPGSDGVYPAIAYALEKHSKGRTWFTWVNDDDLLEAGFEQLCARASNQHGCDIIYGKVRFIDTTDRSMFFVPQARYESLLRACVRTGQVPFTQQGTLIRVSAFNRVGGFQKGFRLSADTDFFLKLLQPGAGALYVDALVASYRLHVDQLSSNEFQQSQEHALIAQRIGLNGSHLRKLTTRAWFLLANWYHLLFRVMRYGFKSIRMIMREMATHSDRH